MFLSILDRVKRSRIHFSLKQDSFRKYGISQNYISMIERGKRQPTPQMIEDIYEAFFSLTNGAIEKLYTRECFRMTDNENARKYIQEAIENKEQATSYYNVYYEIALNYDFPDLCNELNMIMGGVLSNLT